VKPRTTEEVAIIVEFINEVQREEFPWAAAYGYLGVLRKRAEGTSLDEIVGLFL
jgi:hypothetical protein